MIRSAPATARALLEIEGLEVAFPAAAPGAPAVDRWVPAVRGVSLSVERGEMLGLVGESGSGKSLTALAVLGLVPPPARVRGHVWLDGEDLLALPEPALRRVRGGRVAMVFQEPMTAFNPVYTLGFQIAEAVRAHRRLSGRMSRRQALDEAARLLDLVAVPDARRRLGDYPHQLSGGQRQRAMIAMALAGGPDLLLADEPTTALDVTIQAQILELLERLRHELGLAVLLITHDLGVIAQTCDRVAVMYAGQVVEEADVYTLFRAPSHPYTRGLLATLPRLGAPAPRGHLPVLPGGPPDPAARPAGCAFAPRCSEVFDLCGRKEPELLDVGTETGQRARCWLHDPTDRSDRSDPSDATASASEG